MDEFEQEADAVIRDFESGRLKVMVHAFPDVSQFGSYRDVVFDALGGYISWKPERKRLANFAKGLMMQFPTRPVPAHVRGVVQKVAEEDLIDLLEGKGVPTGLAIEASHHVHIVDKDDR